MAMSAAATAPPTTHLRVKNNRVLACYLLPIKVEKNDSIRAPLTIMVQHPPPRYRSDWEKKDI